MKTRDIIVLIFFLIIMVLFLGICTTLCSQYDQNYSKKDAIISASTIGVTLAGGLIFESHMSKNQMALSQFGGIAIGAGYSIIKTTHLFKRIAKRIKLHRLKHEKYNPDPLYIANF